MILINLLPYEFRKEALRDPRMRRTIRLVQGGGVVFVGLTLIFYVQYFFEFRSLKAMQTEWQGLEADVQRVQQIRDEMTQGSEAEKNFIESYVISPFRAASILSHLSEFLPDSIWLLELRLVRQPQNNTLLIKGMSLPGRDRSSVQEIEKYLGDLKAGFPQNIELVLTTSRQLKDRIELTFFTAIFKWA